MDIGKGTAEHIKTAVDQINADFFARENGFLLQTGKRIVIDLKEIHLIPFLMKFNDPHGNPAVDLADFSGFSVMIHGILIPGIYCLSKTSRRPRIDQEAEFQNC
jgi:hypothetical protein